MHSKKLDFIECPIDRSCYSCEIKDLMGYEGFWEQDPEKLGYGSFTSDTGTIWSGKWKDCLLNGLGSIKFKNGSIEEGHFKDGELEGTGK